MAKKGYKGSDSKGYRVYRGYKLNGSSESGNDLYYKIERKDRDKSMTTVYLVVGKNGEDVKARAGADNSTIAGGTGLLNDMVSSIDSYNLEVQITAQDDVMQKAQKKYDGLVEGPERLRKEDQKPAGQAGTRIEKTRTNNNWK